MSLADYSAEQLEQELSESGPVIQKAYEYRKALIQEARRREWSYRRIAEVLDLSPSLIHKIDHQRKENSNA